MCAIRLLRGGRDRTAFVLGGGGNLGAVQVGMLGALLDAGVRPDLLIGCSVGALNAAAIAADPSVGGIKTLARRWSGLRRDDVFPSGRLRGPWQLALRGSSLYSNEGLRRIIGSWLPWRRFEQARVGLHVVATDTASEREAWFSAGDVTGPLLASCALPGVFPPVRINGHTYIDGGVVNNVPLSRAVELGAKRVFVLHVGNFHRPRPQPGRPLDALLQAFSIGRNHRFHQDLAAVSADVEVVSLPAVDPGPLHYTDFSHSARLIDQAWRQTRLFLSSAESERVGS